MKSWKIIGTCLEYSVETRGLFGFFFFCHRSSLLTQFSSLITHCSSLKIPKFSQLHPFGTHHSVLPLLFVSKKKKKMKSQALLQKKIKIHKKPKSQTLQLNCESVVSLIMKMAVEIEL